MNSTTLLSVSKAARMRVMIGSYPRDRLQPAAIRAFRCRCKGMPRPTIQERREEEAAAARVAAIAAYNGACVCCGSTDESTFTWVARLGQGLKVLEPTAPTLAAIARRAPANSEMRCGNCYATLNNTGECTH